MTIRLSDLLSRQARILHTTRRPYFEKRIVEFGGEKYVLYRFLRPALARKFAEILQEAQAAGASLQKVLAHPGTEPEHPCWLALSFEKGEPIHWESDAPAIFTDLGKTLAILHRQASSTPGPLLHTLPELDRKLDDALQTEAVSQWLEASQNRLAALEDFRLNHGDIYAKNIIVTPEDQSVLIDYELFHYGLPGIELAAVLLHHFCRWEEKRKLILEGYLSHCDEQTRHLWHTHWRDFLVAAALQIAAQRDRRIKLQKRVGKCVELILCLPLPGKLRSKLQRSQESRAQALKIAFETRTTQQKLAAAIIELNIAGQGNDPNALITAGLRKALRNRASSQA